ncbi:MBOAT family O-acyltransferase [Cyclobacterium plantarum]|uniref:MBOAT family protein n=1 Tax=Cyclobacterium plantarum TaxID=2716263 RepID=A0ABX0H1H7_9BACT|nr:MBOAT family O-acyltransferase [Cyclobacterium plantarum]NHE55649.1 MBOAT family protein [Cyclobacterium plantarum]
MLFNSFLFLFVFLPIVLLGFYGLGPKVNLSVIIRWLFLCSLFFYGWWKPLYLILIGLSIVFNFFISKEVAKGKKPFLVVGITFNLLILFFYKYADFLIYNVNVISDTSVSYLNWALPLGISFYTFQQIAYLVDSCKGIVARTNFFSYGLFVSFFPQLIAGPIVHHKEVMPQIRNPLLTQINYQNLSRGFFILMMGLAKKIVLADTFGIIANNGYANIELLGSQEAWITSLAYSLQLYFDFSGYSSMAIGLGLLLNIQLPQNFNSPYRSATIQEFWRNWHISLSRFLRDYIYIPLGGNKVSSGRTDMNLMVTFLLGGIWHGAGWTFIIWGFLHGVALVIHRYWKNSGFEIPKIPSILITFLFVNITWVFFRAENLEDATGLLDAMFYFSKTATSDFYLVSNLYNSPIWAAGVLLLFLPNDMQLGNQIKPTFKYGLMTVLLFVLNLIFLNSIVQNDFLYFDF